MGDFADWNAMTVWADGDYIKLGNGPWIPNSATVSVFDDQKSPSLVFVAKGGAETVEWMMLKTSALSALATPPMWQIAAEPEQHGLTLVKLNEMIAQVGPLQAKPNITVPPYVQQALKEAGAGLPSKDAAFLGIHNSIGSDTGKKVGVSTVGQQAILSEAVKKKFYDPVFDAQVSAFAAEFHNWGGGSGLVAIDGNLGGPCGGEDAWE